MNTNDYETYHTIVKSTHPHASNITVFEDGWDFVVFVVNEKQIFRFPRRKEYVKKLPIETAFLQQFSNMSPVAVPEFTVHEHKNILYVTSPFIPGVALTPAVAQTFTKENRMEIAKKLGTFLSILHTFSIKEAKKIGIEEIHAIEAWQIRLNKVKQDVFPHLSSLEQNWVQELFTNFLTNIEKFPPPYRVTHSDIMFRHILVNTTTQTLSGIIDFGDIVIGDPAFDFTFLAYYGQGFLDEVYTNYILPMDANFDFRRKFYGVRSPIAEFEYAIANGDSEKISTSKNKLSQFIKELSHY